MNLLSGNTTKTFNLLSIGKRGVGKTVFLAGSYAELQNNQIKRPQQLWFDCQDTQVQKKIENILSYVVRTGEYPPATMNVTNFSFNLKCHNLGDTQTLCHFHWWDIPGEICKIDNPDFRKMVFNSHGCCVFIDANALVYNNNGYTQALEEIIEQVMVIASLVSLNELKYAFALILTKCDLLQTSQIKEQQLHKNMLQPLTSKLDAVRANYQTFYSFIPVVPKEGVSTLNAKGAATPLLWLVRELSKAHTPKLKHNLFDLVPRSQPKSLQPQQNEVDGTLQSLLRSTDKALKVKKIFNLYLLPTRKNLLVAALICVGLVGVMSFLLVDYESLLQVESKTLDTLNNITALRQSGQFEQAAILMEQLVQEESEQLEWRLQLAQLYEITGQVTKAETAYDQVLAKQQNNVKALLGKALLRKAQGDIKAARALFVQAEKAAPDKLKTQVRAIAQKTLDQPGKKLTPSAK